MTEPRRGPVRCDDRAIPWRLEVGPAEAERRLRWARRQGHPHYFWPDVEPADWRAGLEVLERATRSVLASEPASLPWSGDSDVRALGVAGYTSGIGPLVGYWLETDRLSAPPLVQRLFGVHLRHGRERARRLDAELERAGGALREAGIADVVAVKASHTARYFPEPGVRPAVDVDLVVRPELFDRAERALEGAGYTVGAREGRPRKTTWLAPGSSRLPRSFEVMHSGSQYAVDLHATLERNFFGVRTTGPGPVDGVPTASLPSAPVRVLRQPALLLYHALHASEGFHNLTLIRLVELVFMIRRDTEEDALDWTAFRRHVEARDAWRFVYPALELTARLAPGTVEPGTLDAARAGAPHRMRRVVGGLTPATARRLRRLSLRESFVWCETPVDYLRRFAHMLFPAPAGRSLSRLGRHYLTRAYRLLRRTVSVGPPGDV